MSRPADFDLVLDCGTPIRLQAIEQWLFYAGLIEGYPTRERNEARLPLELERAAEHWHTRAHLIPPVERLIPWASDKPYPFGTPAALPDVICRGLFRSFDTVTRKGLEGPDYRSLAIIWFQDEWAMPIEPSVHVIIRAIDWTSEAEDCWI